MGESKCPAANLLILLGRNPFNQLGLKHNVLYIFVLIMHCSEQNLRTGRSHLHF